MTLTLTWWVLPVLCLLSGGMLYLHGSPNVGRNPWRTIRPLACVATAMVLVTGHYILRMA